MKKIDYYNKNSFHKLFLKTFFLLFLSEVHYLPIFFSLNYEYNSCNAATQLSYEIFYKNVVNFFYLVM